MSHEYFMLQINGQPTSIHRRYEDALRVGLLCRYRSPQDDIKVFQISSTEEAKQDTAVLHWSDMLLSISTAAWLSMGPSIIDTWSIFVCSNQSGSTPPTATSVDKAAVPPSVSRYALPTNLPHALKQLADSELDRLLSAVIAEQKRRGKKVAVSNESSRKRQIQSSAVPLTQGKLNAVRAAFKAGVTPSRIAKQFGISQSDVRKALVGTTSKEWSALLIWLTIIFFAAFQPTPKLLFVRAQSRYVQNSLVILQPFSLRCYLNWKCDWDTRSVLSRCKYAIIRPTRTVKPVRNPGPRHNSKRQADICLSPDHNSRTLYSFLLAVVEIESGETTALILHWFSAIWLSMRSVGMSEEIKPDATLADVLPQLKKPKDYVRGVLRNILKHKSDGMLPVVRIGITGKGFSPYYRIESGDQTFGAFNGASHKPFKNIELHEHTWSTKHMTFEQVQAQMGQLNNWKGKKS